MTLNYKEYSYVPLRFIAEQLGVEVIYEGDSRRVLLNKTDAPKHFTESSELSQTSQQKQIAAKTFYVDYYINGEYEWMDDRYKTLNVEGHLYVPLRFIADSLGVHVTYESATKTIYITNEEQ